jgi:hypothetical protein
MKMTPDKNFKLQISSEELLILEKRESLLLYFHNDLTHDYVDHDPGRDILYHKKFLNDEIIPTLPPGIFPNPKSLNVKTPINQCKLNFKDKDPKIFLPFITIVVIYLFLHSFGNEDTIFDPGIVSTSLHYLNTGGYLIGVELSHASNVYPNILNKSPMEIVSSTSCSPMDQ